ncbi:hypothetical protein FRC00_013020, partial [Tulasnella sp. 408]
MRDKKGKQPARCATPWGTHEKNALDYVGGQLKPQPDKKRKDLADSTSQDASHSKPKIKKIKLILPENSESKPLPQAESPGLGSSQAISQPLALSPPGTERPNHVPEKTYKLPKESPADTQDRISFGTLRSLRDPKLLIPLWAPSNNSYCTKVA